MPKIWFSLFTLTLFATSAFAEHPAHTAGNDVPAAHGGLLVENYYYHLPMFAAQPLGHPHTYQGVWKVTYQENGKDITQETLAKFAREQASPAFKAFRFQIFTVDPTPFVLTQFGAKLPDFTARLFAGHFEFPSHRREITNEKVKATFTVHAEGAPLRLHRLNQKKLTRPKSLTYFSFGGKYLAKWLTVGPDSDHIVEVALEGEATPLPDGAQVVFRDTPDSPQAFLKTSPGEDAEVLIAHDDPGQPVEIRNVRLRVVSEVFKNDVLE